MEEQAEGNAPKRRRIAAEDLSSEGSLENQVAALRAALLASLEDSREMRSEIVMLRKEAQDARSQIAAL